MKKLIFFIKFFAIYSVFLFFINPVWLENFLAWLISGFTGLTVVDNQLFFEGHIFIISKYCTGILTMGLLAGVVFGCRKPVLKEKVFVFCLGCLLIFLLNILRLYLIVFLAKILDFGLIDIFHIITWFLMAGFVLIYWFFVNNVVLKHDLANLL